MSPNSSSDAVLPDYPLDSRSTSNGAALGWVPSLPGRFTCHQLRHPSCPWLEVIASPPAWGSPGCPSAPPPSALWTSLLLGSMAPLFCSPALHTSRALHHPPVNSELGLWGRHGFVSESPSDANCNQAREGLGPEPLGVWGFPRLPAPTPPLPSSALGTPDHSPRTQVLRGLQPWGPQGFALQAPPPFLLLVGLSFTGLGPGASHRHLTPSSPERVPETPVGQLPPAPRSAMARTRAA